MKQRVSFYRKNEVIDGRAPRYMVDIEAETKVEALAIVQKTEKAIVVRSVYKSPEKPIRQTPSYVFENAESRNRWYSNNKSAQKERLCHVCHKNGVEHYKRICASCRTAKACVLCGQNNIPKPSRRRYCAGCSVTKKESQEKFHRERRAKKTTIDRIREQMAWAQAELKTVKLDNCKFASRYQGLRVPHYKQDAKGFNPNRCRGCLQKFIDVQTVYLSNLLVEQDNTFVASLRVNENALSHAAGV